MFKEGNPRANIYVSSTYSDLVAHRQAVVEILRKLEHTVVAMEDYVAADQRSLDRCLDDVARCDVYVGIFAWRCGYVPDKDNPEHKSITELEYQKAAELGKPFLLFLVEEGAPWTINQTDAWTGENEQGRRIKGLRAELVKERLASFFATADQLASLVIVAVTKTVDEDRQPAANGTHPLQARTVTSDAVLVYSAADQEFSFQLAQNKRKLSLSDRVLFAEQEADLRELDQLACQRHMAVAVLSDAMLNQMEEQRERARPAYGFHSRVTGVSAPHSATALDSLPGQSVRGYDAKHRPTATPPPHHPAHVWLFP